MTRLENSTWVWVIVIEPNGDSQYLGQQDAKSGVAYIPVFLQKEEAQQGMLKFKLDREKKYEVQAVLYGDLSDDSAAHGFMLFILDADGRIIEKIAPAVGRRDSTGPT